MRYTGPKNKIARREGTDLGLKTTGSKSHAMLLRRLNIPPGQHGVKKGRRKLSERGKQLREKQKLRALFGITESQLKRYFEKAVRMKGNTEVLLGQLLEKRLDNIIYRLGLAPTRASARQLVNHGHIKVDEKTVTIASYDIPTGKKIDFQDEKSYKIPYIEASLAEKDIIIPAWLKRKGVGGELVAEPTSEEVEKQINLRLVVEYYSR